MQLRDRIVTEDTPLLPTEQKFITEYMKSGNARTAAELAGYENPNRFAELLKQPNIIKEIDRLMEELKKESLATADEVMSYFTSVMRGEIKDQFGLDAPLAERTKAAMELAKRTIDIDNRQKGIADQSVAITLDWSRK